MEKPPESPHEAGRRGTGWIKAKPVETLDLLILAAEWDHGRRTGWLSRLHVGARVPETGGLSCWADLQGPDGPDAVAADGPSARAGDSPRRWTVYVRPELVVEIAFADMRRSRRCPGGGALRFARVVRYREDNRPGDVDTIQTVQARKMESMLETRRAFVRHATGLVGLALPLLAACNAAAPATAPTAAPAKPAAATAAPSGQTAAATVAPQAKGVALGKLPTYLPIQNTVSPPDLPGTPDGLVNSGWTRYPKQLFQAVKEPPGKGGEITVSLESNNPPMPPLEQNAQWQALNKAVNAKLNVLYIPFSDFDQKWAAIQAGNDLPDVMCTITRPSTPIVPAFLDAKCTDLTAYLAGDAVKDYPNLAAIPSRAWKSALVNGKIYGVPIPLSPYFWWFWGHQEVLDQLGLSYPKSAAEFKDVALKVNNPQNNTWAIGSEGGSQYAFSTVNGLWNGVFKAPNYWAVDSNGNFTYLFETEEYRQAMLYAADLFKAGLYHPRSLEYNTLSARTDFMARKMIFRFDGLQPSPYWGGSNAQPMDPPSHITLVPPFSADGQSKPVYYFGRPNFGISLIKKSNDARVKELLGLLNFIASPFGSQEFELISYGVKGVDFNYDDNGNPIFTDQGKAEIGSAGSAWYSLTRPAPYYYSPADPNAPQIYQGYEKVLAPLGVEDASIGTFSPTFAAKGTILLDGIGGGAQDIIAGRRGASDWDQLVKDWQNNGGNQIKSEFAASYAQLMGG